MPGLVRKGEGCRVVDSVLYQENWSECGCEEGHMLVRIYYAHVCID